MDAIANVTREQLMMQARFQVRMAYRAFVYRDPTESEFDYWTNRIVNEGLTIPAAERLIQTSQEAIQAEAELAAQRQAEIDAARLEVAQARIAAEIEAARRAGIEAERIAQMQAQAQADAQAEADRMAAMFAAVQAQETAQREAEAMQRAELENKRIQEQLRISQAAQEASLAYAVEVRANVADDYRQVLMREANAQDIAYWSDLILRGEIDDELVAVRLSQSDEGIIVGAYQQNLYRLPRNDERQYWVSEAQRGVPIDRIIELIANSPEAQQYHEVIVPTAGSTEAIVQVINPVGNGSIDPIMGGSTWNTAYTNQDMIAADPQADPKVDLQNYYTPDVNISDLEAVSPLGDTSAALAFKAREEIYRAYTASLKREPAEAEYQYWEPQLVNRAVSLADFKRYVAESAEAKALTTRSNAVALTDTPPPEVVADAAKKTEGIGAAIGLLSALTFFLGQ